MRFNYQNMAAGAAEQRKLAEQISKSFEPLDFTSPKHLMDTLDEYGRENDLKLVVRQHNGVVNVHGESGIMIRIRSNN